MKVCIAHGGDVSEPSGGTDRVTAFASGLQRNGIDVILVVPEPTGEFPDQLEPVDVRPVDTEPFGVSNSLVRAGTVARGARRIAENEDAFLQLEHSTLAGVGTVLGSEDYILDMHDLAFARYDHVETKASPVLRRIVGWLERRAVESADRIVVVSQYMRQVLRKKWGVSPGSVDVIENGFYPERITGFRDLDIVPGRICFLGTLHPKIDVDTIVELARLSAVEELCVIGDGARRTELQRLKKRRGLEALRVLGRLPDEEAFELVGSAEAVINPQTMSELQRSSSPVKLYYYAALGKAMVVSEGPDVAEKLAEEDAALVVDSQSNFVESVERILQNDDHAERLGRNARRVAETFKWERRVERLKNLYH